MPTDLFRVHFVCFTDEPDGIRQQHIALCFLDFVFLPLFVFFICDLLHGGYLVKLEFVNTYYHKDIYLKFSFVFPNIL